MSDECAQSLGESGLGPRRTIQLIQEGESRDFTKKKVYYLKMFYTRYDNVLTQYLQKGETFVHRKITETEMNECPIPKKIKNKKK